MVTCGSCIRVLTLSFEDLLACGDPTTRKVIDRWFERERLWAEKVARHEAEWRERQEANALS